MNEPTLLDVVKAIFTRGRVVRGLLVLAGLYLAYRSALSLGLSQALPLTLLGLGLLLTVGALFLRRTPALPALSTALHLPDLHLRERVDLRGVLGVVWLGIGIGLAYVAQNQLFKAPQQYWIGLGLWVVALACWLPIMRVKPEASAAVSEAVAPVVNWPVALAGLGLSLATYWFAGGHLYTRLVVLTWVASVGLWCAGILGWQMAHLDAGWGVAQRWWAQVRQKGFYLRISWTLVAVIAIFALGTYLRFYQLNDVPREMTSDHVEKLLDVNDVLNGQYTTFFPRNTGREPFQFYFTAALAHLFDLPLAHLTLKIGTAIAGSATLIFVFLLARELAGTEVGLLTMLLMAVARWPIAMSRAGLRYPFNPLFVAPAFYFLVRGLKSGRRSDFVWAGLFVAGGLHGYSAFRIVPITIVAIGVLWLVWDLIWRHQHQLKWKPLTLNLSLLFSVVLIGLMPLLRYMMDEPRMFWERVLTRAGTQEQSIVGDTFTILVTNIWRAFLMFNYTSDEVWTVNISNWITLSSLLAALFGFGFVYFVVRAVRGDRWAALVLGAWFLGLMPSALSLAFPNENPSIVRAGGAAPFVFLIAAWPLALFRRAIVKFWPGWSGQAIAAGTLVLLVGSIARTDLHDYFITFRDQYAMSATNPSEVARPIRAFVAEGGDPSQVWLKGYPYWLDLRSTAIEAFNSFAWQNAVLEVEQLTVIGNDPRPKLIILHIWDRPSIAKLRELYPNGVLAYHTSVTPGKDFLTFFVPGVGDFDENTLPPPP